MTSLPEDRNGWHGALLVLTPKTSATWVSRHFICQQTAQFETSISDLQRLLRMGGGSTDYGYVCREPIPAGESLAHARRDPKVLARRSELASYGRKVKLGDIFTVLAPRLRGVVPTVPHDEPGAIRVVRGRDLTRAGEILGASEGSTWVPSDVNYDLRSGDLLLPQITILEQGRALPIVEVGDALLPLVAGDNVLVLRPTADLSPSHRQFVIDYLRSPLAAQLMPTGATSKLRQRAARISPRELSASPVPLPDEALTAALEDLAHAELQLGHWSREACELRQTVFLDETAADARRRIVESGRRLRRRADVAGMLDDAGYLIRTTYPHPVAYRWRSVEALTTGEPSDVGYEAILDAAEVLLCYLAQVSLALAAERGIPVKALEPVAAKLSSGRSGPGMGDWVAILEELRSKPFAGLPEASPLAQIRGMFIDEELFEARRRLSERRNAESHLRRVSRAGLPKAIAESRNDLLTLMEGAAFIADFSLVYVENTRWDSFRQRAKVAYRELVGDHPTVPTRSAEVSRNDLEAQSLYIRDGQGQYHLLRPYLVSLDCPECHNWSTFHVDRAPAGSIELKSLEHGHTCPGPELRSALAHVGLLH